jgi:hypothetical protein
VNAAIAHGQVLCDAKAKTTGGLCTAQALLGTNPPRCRHHAGRKTAEVKAAAEVARRADRIYADYPGINRTSNDNPLDDLLRIKNEALRWLDVCRTLVGELTEVRYKSRSAGEQLRAEIQLWERALARPLRPNLRRPRPTRHRRPHPPRQHSPSPRRTPTPSSEPSPAPWPTSASTPTKPQSPKPSPATCEQHKPPQHTDQPPPTTRPRARRNTHRLPDAP